MPDREKVIQGLKCCAENKCQKCPFVRNGEDYEHCQKLMMRKALELLKDQEPISDSYHYVYQCGSCLEMVSTHYNYCPNCGKKVKWE